MVLMNEAAATLSRPAAGTRRLVPMQLQLITPALDDPRLPPRFWAKVRLGPIPAHRPNLGPCWVWTGCLDRQGYGRFGIGSRTDGTARPALAHRWAYERLIGPFAPGLEPDHLCRNPPCVRPQHLEPVTRGENVRRGDSPLATRSRGAENGCALAARSS